MFNMVLNLLKAFLMFLKWPLIIFFIFLAVFGGCITYWYIINALQGRKLKKGSHKKVKKGKILKRLFYQLPKQMVEDNLNKDPDFFEHQGCIIFEGRQGAGKTVSMVQYAMQMQEEYPRALCTTNLGYTKEDTPLKDWRMLMNYKNGIYGVIVCMDELQNWFSSNDSKNFPPEMLSIITQNRKNRRIILGTSQNFYLLAKAIRSQATEVRRCATYFGALTIVRKFEPILDSEGNVQEFKPRGFYFFVHNKDLRECYDTFKVIERAQKVGFKDELPHMENTTYNVFEVKEGKKRK